MGYFLWLKAESCFDNNETLYCGFHAMKQRLKLMKLQLMKKS